MRQLLNLLLFLGFADAFSILDLKKVKLKLEPEKCPEDIKLVTLVHSAPENLVHRNTIRKTWGSRSKTIFLLGKDSAFNKKLKKEHEKHGDILQFSFKDSYKNMTYKHLGGYW